MNPAPSPDADPNPPRPPLTRERVLAAALALADADGLEGLTMRRLAQALGVEAMSLYNHVEGKDAVLAGIVDLVVAEMARPRQGGDWRAEMRARAVSAHGVLMRHPWAALPLISEVNVGPAMLAYVEATLGCLVGAGFSYRLADWAWNAMDAHIYGFTLKELRFPFAPEDYAREAAAYLPMLPAERFPHLRGLSLAIIAGAYDGRQDFRFGLEMVLDGLERRLAGAAQRLP